MRLYISFTSIVFTLFSIAGCRSSKIVDARVHYILEIQSEKDKIYLEDTYADFEISDVKRISRSKFQYSAHFACRAKDCRDLEELLSRDKNVIKFFLDESKIDQIQTSNGSKASRTGPIGSQGGQ